MKRNFKLKAVAAAILMTGSMAQAAPVVVANWGNHDPAEMGAFFIATAGATPIDHIYTFSLNQSYDGLVTTVTNDAPPFFDITGGLLRLWKSNGDTNYTNDTLLGSLAFDSTAVNTTFALPGGDYFYEVTGTINGVMGGSYLISSTVSAVPEPETYAMLLAGLGLVGFSLRRREV